MRIQCFVESAKLREDKCVLPEKTSHHLAHVLRVDIGDRVAAFDGEGNAARAEVVGLRKGVVELGIISRWKCSPPKIETTLFQALPKGAKIDLIIQKAVELGGTCIQPIQSQRSIVRLSPTKAEKKLKRWRKIARHAAEQSGNCWLTEINPLCQWEDIIERLSNYDLVLLGDLSKDARPLRKILRETPLPTKPPKIAVLVGPEGDFSPEEIEAFKAAGAISTTFGDRVLRTETAALFVLSALSYEFL